MLNNSDGILPEELIMNSALLNEGDIGESQITKEENALELSESDKTPGYSEKNNTHIVEDMSLENENYLMPMEIEPVTHENNIQRVKREITEYLYFRLHYLDALYQTRKDKNLKKNCKSLINSPSKANQNRKPLKTLCDSSTGKEFNKRKIDTSKKNCNKILFEKKLDIQKSRLDINGLNIKPKKQSKFSMKRKKHHQSISYSMDNIKTDSVISRIEKKRDKLYMTNESLRIAHVNKKSTCIIIDKKAATKPSDRKETSMLFGKKETLFNMGNKKKLLNEFML